MRGGDDEHVGHVGRAVRHAEESRGARDVRRDAADGEYVAAVHAQPRQRAERLARAGDALEEHAARLLFLREIRERPAVDRGIGHDDVEELARQVE